jgi:hypothetical protein
MGMLSLDGLKTLDTDVASALAAKQGWLVLDGVTKIEEVAEENQQLAFGSILGRMGMNPFAPPPAEPGDAMEAPLPNDVSTLTSLTVEQAKTLVGKAISEDYSLPHLKQIVPEVARRLARGNPRDTINRDYDFPALQLLTPASARGLSRCRGKIRLGSLRELDPDVAAAFEQHSNTLILEAVTELSAEAAEALARHRGDVELPALDADAAETFKRHRGQLTPVTAMPPVTDPGALETLSPEAARELARHPFDLNLMGLKTLTPEAALALWQHREIRFNPYKLDWGSDRIESLSIDEAEDIGAHDFHTLSFDGLSSLDPEVAEALAWRLGNQVFSFAGLTELSEDTAAALSWSWEADNSGRHNRNLFLDGVRALSPGTARALRPFTGLSLNGLTSLSADEARDLMPGGWGRLSLDGLTSLSPDVAEIFRKNFVFDLSINGVRHLNPDTAAALFSAKSDGVKVLSLNGLTTLSPQTAQALVVPNLSLNGLTSLSLETAQAIVVPNLSLDGVSVLDPDTAAALVAASGVQSLSLNGVSHLNPDTAAALVAASGFEDRDGIRFLRLNGLTSLSPEVALALASGRLDRLDLNSITTLSPEAARALARLFGRARFNGMTELWLDGLADLGPETAKGLAGTARGRLSLGGLKSISPEAATSLPNHHFLSLNGLTSLSMETARALARREKVFLPDELRNFPNLSLDALRELGPPEGRLSLDGLSDLPADVAGALAEMRGQMQISLNGLREISLEAAEALVKSRANAVELLGLENPSPEVLRTLERCWRQRGRGSEVELKLMNDVEEQMLRLPRIDDDVNR